MPRIKKTPKRSPVLAAILLLAVAAAICVYSARYIPPGFFDGLFVQPPADSTPTLTINLPKSSEFAPGYVTLRDVYCLEHPGDSEDLALGVIREGTTVAPTGAEVDGLIEVQAPRYRPTCWIAAEFVDGP